MVEAVRAAVEKFAISTHFVGAVQSTGIIKYKMVLIGETGCGKTSFLNFICNFEFIQKLGFDEASDNFRPFHDIMLENARAQKMQSKTDGAKMYKAKVFRKKIRIIDSPGFGDSRGLKQDKENARKIIETLTSEDYVNCICLLINGRTPRMTATLQYVLTEITAIMPRKVLDNIIVVFTNCTDILDLTFDPALLSEYFGKKFEDDRIFCLENPYCRFEKAKEKQHFLPPKKVAASLKQAFEKAGEMLEEMCKVILPFSPVYTYQFGELYQKKQLIEKDTLVILEEYEYQKQLESEIGKAKEGVRAASNSKELHANYQSTSVVERWVPVDTDRHNTLCGARGCHSNCHIPCNLDKAFDKEVFRHCRSMSGGTTCTVCGHSYRLHYHNEVKFEKKVEEVELIDEKTRAQFEKAKDMEEMKWVILTGLEKKRDESIKKRKQLSKKLQATILEFEELGISRNYAKLLDNQIAIIEHRLEGEVGDEADDLRKVKEELEKKLTIVNEVLQRKKK